MWLLGRSIHVRGKGCAHEPIRDLVLIPVPFLSEADAGIMKRGLS